MKWFKTREEKDIEKEVISDLVSNIKSDMYDMEKIWNYIQEDKEKFCKIINITACKELGLDPRNAPSLIFNYIKYLEERLNKKIKRNYE